MLGDPKDNPMKECPQSGEYDPMHAFHILPPAYPETPERPLAADMIKQPKHYEVMEGVEAKAIIKAQLIRLYGDKAYEAYCHGNMLKYLLRKKFDVCEDVAKVGRYSEMYLGEDE